MAGETGATFPVKWQVEPMGADGYQCKCLGVYQDIGGWGEVGKVKRTMTIGTE